MSNPKFIVLKLRDFKIPLLVLLIAIVLIIFFTFKGKSTQTFAPDNSYEDGTYIAGILLSDAQVDLVVTVSENAISQVALSGLDETASTLYSDLVSSVDYVNTYVTATQNLKLPENTTPSAATLLLMDAITVALSEDPTASLTSTYETVSLTNTALNTEIEEDIFVDEFEDPEQTSTSEETDLEVLPELAQESSDELVVSEEDLSASEALAIQ